MSRSMRDIQANLSSIYDVHFSKHQSSRQEIDNMGASASVPELIPSDLDDETKFDLYESLETKCLEILEEYPGNRCCKYALLYADSDEGQNLSVEGMNLTLTSMLYSRISNWKSSYFAILNRHANFLQVYQDWIGQSRLESWLLRYDTWWLFKVWRILWQSHSRLPRRQIS